ncbi:AraC family transcriptional regulator [Vibrio sinaloensis]|uniref:AraC family transcriptional regulator n=1 Tax=Photobacterium sp. (strain ATCC 43367) TaxID=379097 RepID=UPI00205B2F80|nr:AraC family transcriptional regulator [Vibrio sinaloensis]UPQ89421.1 AraC family transcriptional regulator [Vibrio sinaloensis]
MLTNINTTSSSNLVPFVRYFEKHRIEWKQLAKVHQIPEDLTSRTVWLSSQQVMSFLLDMMRHSNKRVGIEVGKLITLGQISTSLEEKFKQCNDLEEAIVALIKLMPELNSHVVVWVEKMEGHWYLCHRGAYHPSTPGFDQTEWFRSFALLSMCRLFLGKDWVPEHAFMSFSEHLTKGLPIGFSKTAFSFGHPFGAIRIDLEDDFKPIPPSLEDEVEWSQRVKRLSQTYAVLPFFSVDWFAKFLSMSARTLQRRLAEHGLSVKQLRDEARRDVAIQLLTQDGLSPDETSWRCGYNDLSNFNRAFRSWLNMTPAQYRRKHFQCAQ